MGLRIDVVTIFPDYFGSPLGVSLIGKAAVRGDIEFGVHDLRRWAADVHHTVDDVPFGGGPGMVMMAEPLAKCLAAIEADRGEHASVVLFSPVGRKLDHASVEKWSASAGAILVCGATKGWTSAS